MDSFNPNKGNECSLFLVAVEVMYISVSHVLTRQLNLYEQAGQAPWCGLEMPLSSTYSGRGSCSV